MSSKLFNPIKNKIAATIALLFFVLLGAGTIMAMKVPGEKDEKALAAKSNKDVATKKRAIQTWYFNGNDIDNVTTASYYGSSPSASCGSGTDLPCEIQYDNSVYPTLNAYLSAHNSTYILNNAVSKKEEAP